MFLDSNLLPLARHVLKNPFKKDDLSSQLKKSFSKLSHNLNDLLLFLSFYEKQRDELGSVIPSLYYDLETKYSLNFIDNTISKIDNHSIKVQMERLYDLFELKIMGDESLDINCIPENYLNIINFLRLNELFALCLTGIAKVEKKDNNFIFSSQNNEQKKNLYLTWFARNAENQSILNTLRTCIELSDVPNKNFFVKIIFDKVFYLNTDDFPKEINELNGFRYFLDMLSIVESCITLAKSENFSSGVKIKGILHRLPLSEEKFYELIKLQQQLLLVTEQFIVLKNMEVHLNVITLFYGLRAFFDKITDRFNERNKRNNLIGGMFFEKQIKDRLNNKFSEYNGRFEVLDGIYQHEIKKAQKEYKYDIEYIIYDKNIKFYYFIQVKYASLGERSYLNGVIEQVQNDIGKGLQQLRGVKYALENGYLSEIFIKRGVNVNKENSAFILLHNIPQLDYQKTKDNIVLYDWNSFRNLLNNGNACMRSVHTFESIKLSEDISLEDPMKVITTLLNIHKGYTEVREFLDKQANETNSFSLGGSNILIKGLGI